MHLPENNMNMLDTISQWYTQAAVAYLNFKYKQVSRQQ